MNKTIDISIILEWENVLLSEEDRCFVMLAALREQIRALGRSVEVIVLFSPDQVSRTAIEPALTQHLLGAADAASSFDLRLEEAPGLHYYELKNEGARRARGDVIVFIDSDVVPEAHWLSEISRLLFERDDIAVVAGHTYLAYDSFIEKAFALGWFFPLRNPQNRVHQERQAFFANSVAFRRELFLQYGFPAMNDGRTRGACGALTRNLRKAGVTIWTNTGARAHHPPPSGASHYMIRALAEGRDRLMKRTSRGKSRGKALLKSLEYNLARAGGAGPRIVKQRSQVGLPLWQTPAAIALVAGYYVLAFAGSCIASIFPTYAAAHWRI